MLPLAAIILATAAHAGMIEDIERAEAVMSQPWALTAEDRAIVRPPDAVSYLERGQASWYGRTGHRTAAGEPYPTTELTCAHRTLGFGTIVRVTRKDNGKSIRCRINDRGPWINGRIIDLSPRAALGLGIVHSGVAKVVVEVINERP